MDGEQSRPSPRESGQVDRIPVATYNPHDQVHASADGETGGYRTPSLYSIAVERTRAGREVQSQTGISFFTTGGMGLEWAVDHTSPDVGRHFDVHGFSSKTDMHALDSLLTQGVQEDRTLYTMPLVRAGGAMEAFGAEIPKTEAGIYLISGYDSKLAGEEGGIRFVGVGEEYSRVVDEMRGLYPQAQIVPWHELPQVLTEAANNATGQQLQAETLTETNRPYYPEKRVFPHAPVPEAPVREVRPDVTLKDIADGDIW